MPRPSSTRRSLPGEQSTASMGEGAAGQKHQPSDFSGRCAQRRAQQCTVPRSSSQAASACCQPPLTAFWWRAGLRFARRAGRKAAMDPAAESRDANAFQKNLGSPKVGNSCVDSATLYHCSFLQQAAISAGAKVCTCRARHSSEMLSDLALVWYTFVC